MKNKLYFNYIYISLFILIFILTLTKAIQNDLVNKNILDIFYGQLNQNLPVNSDTSIILNPLKIILKETFFNITNDLNESISVKCYSNFNNTFFSYDENISNAYLDLFLDLLSINTNEISYFEDCIYKDLNTSYVILKFYKKKDIYNTAQMKYYYPDNGIRGFCLPSGCIEDEYNLIIKELITRRYEILPISSDFLEYPNKSFIIAKEYEENINKIELSFNYIFLTITIIIIIISLFPSIAFHFSFCFLKCCFCCSKSKITNKALKKKFIGFKKCFSMSHNFNKLDEQNIKDEGLSFIKGIRGINIFFYTIGMVFIIILHSPSKMYSPQIITELFQNPFYCIIFYSVKYAPVFLMACSGAVLGYKFLNFLDEKIKQKNFEESSKEEKKENINIINNDNSNIIDRNKKIDFESINKGFLFRFIFYQFDRYINFIIILLFTRYSLYYFTDLITKQNPTWEFFCIFLNEKISLSEMILNFLLFPRFNFIHNNEDDNDPIFTIIFDYYWLAFNEIILFLMGIIIIYYCIKKRKQILYGVYIITALCIFFKISLYIFKINKFKGNEDNYAPYILTYSYYGRIIINPLSNLGIYLIGVYFGILLYAYQKEISAKKAEIQGKRFMNKISLKLLRILKSTKHNKSFIISIISLFLVFIYSIGQIFLNVELREDNTDTEIIIRIFNFFYIFDNEIIVFVTLNSIFYMVIVMNIDFFSFLKGKFWRILYKIYFSHITVCIPIIIFFVYHSNTRVFFNFINIIFYSSIIITITFILSLFYCVVFEMPLKNIIRAIYKRKDKKTIINKIDDIEPNIRAPSAFTINESINNNKIYNYDE